MIQYEYYTKTQELFGDESVSASDFLVDFSVQVAAMAAIPESNEEEMTASEYDRKPR